MRKDSHKWRVLEAMGERIDIPEEMYVNFRHLTQDTGLTRVQVRRACRSLRREGLVHFSIGLQTEEGDMAGAGYTITHKGVERLRNH